MQLIPHRHFGMPGRIQTHMLVYTVVLAAILTVLFDLSRIAALGAMLYLVMDLAVHWGVLRHLRQTVGANPLIVVMAILIDLAVLAGLVAVKLEQDPVIVGIASTVIFSVYLFEVYFLKPRRAAEVRASHHHDDY